MKINDREVKGLQIEFTQNRNGPPSFVIRKTDTRLADELSEKVSQIRDNSTKVREKGGIIDILA